MRDDNAAGNIILPLDSDGNVTEPPIKGGRWQPLDGYDQIDPALGVEGHIVNELRQVLYSPDAVDDAGVGQGHTLAHFSAQPEPFLTFMLHRKHPLTTS
jgi:hypothetical protein